MLATITIDKRHSRIGAEVRGVDLAAPIDDEMLAILHDIWMANPLLIFPDQPVTDAQQIAFARRFGALEIHPSRDHRSSAHPEIYRVSNVAEDGSILPAQGDAWKYLELTWIWHSDSSFREVPSNGSILHGIEVTEDGGDTLFCNLYAVLEALDGPRRAALERLRVVHSHDQILTHSAGLEAGKDRRYAQLPPVTHPLVRRHPITREPSLFISPHTMARVAGWSVPASRELFAELTGIATEERFVYRHRWRRDDVIMWDNRCTMHAVMPYAHDRVRRVMHRTTIVGDAPVEAAMPRPGEMAGQGSPDAAAGRP